MAVLHPDGAGRTNQYLTDRSVNPRPVRTRMDTEFTVHPEATFDWTDHALCKGLTHVFFGPAAERPERRVEREAIASAYCMSCPVLMECRQTARLNREHGFWGCENDEERAAAGYAPRSPSRRAVIQARDRARRRLATERDEPCPGGDDTIGCPDTVPA